ncbi:MAG: hypothetical protein AUG51_21860 [Acidobacteria bacterium 13_1_20CM_3_53_8]|nr:MAG: hypothetical protein AUG51_21860 [Acidobacteria bacterium 13_1_20CM_3_53_8]
MFTLYKYLTLLPSAHADSVRWVMNNPRLSFRFVRGYILAACLRRLIRVASIKLLIRNIS